MNYDTIEAGREMDALVAEKVMGWKRGGKGDHTKPLHYKSLDHPGEIRNNWAAKGEHDYLTSPDGNTHYLCACADEAIKDHIDLPEYSTSISAAWEVVERFEQGAFAPEQVAACVNLVCSDGIEDERYYCAFFSPSLAKVEAFGKTMPEAICRAALKATGKEGK